MRVESIERVSQLHIAISEEHFYISEFLPHWSVIKATAMTDNIFF